MYPVQSPLIIISHKRNKIHVNEENQAETIFIPRMSVSLNNTRDSQSNVFWYKGSMAGISIRYDQRLSLAHHISVLLKRTL